MNFPSRARLSRENHRFTARKGIGDWEQDARRDSGEVRNARRTVFNSGWCPWCPVESKRPKSNPRDFQNQIGCPNSNAKRMIRATGQPVQGMTGGCWVGTDARRAFSGPRMPLEAFCWAGSVIGAPRGPKGLKSNPWGSPESNTVPLDERSHEELAGGGVLLELGLVPAAHAA